MPFDLESARKAGYSDDEILRHLATKRGFDLEGAIESGYKPAEVLNYLASAPPPRKQPPRAPLVESVKAAPEVAKLALSSMMVGLPKLFEGIDAAITAVPEEPPQRGGLSPAEARRQAREKALAKLKEKPEYKQAVDVQKGIATDIAAAIPENQGFLGEVTTSFAQSAPALGAGVLTGLTLGPAAGITVGMGLGALQQAEAGFSETEDPTYALRTALYEAAGERVGMRAIFKGAKTVLRRITQAIAANFGEEAAVEFTQGVDYRLSEKPDMTLGEILADRNLWHSSLVAGTAGVVGAGVALPVVQAADTARQRAADAKIDLLLQKEMDLELSRRRSPDEIARLLLSPTRTTPIGEGAWRTPGLLEAELKGSRVRPLPSREPAIGGIEPEAEIASLARDIVQVQVTAMNLVPSKTAAELKAELVQKGATTPLTPMPEALEDIKVLRGLSRGEEWAKSATLATSEAQELRKRYLAEDITAHNFAKQIDELVPQLQARAEGYKYAFGAFGTVIKPWPGFRASAFDGRTVTAASDPDTVAGSKFDHTLFKQPGRVVALGVDSPVLAQKLVSITKGWVDKIVPDMNPIVITIEEDLGEQAFGRARGIYDTGLVNIRLSPATMKAWRRLRATEAKAPLSKTELEAAVEAHLVEVLAHELGHHIGAVLLQRAPKEIQRAVLNAWQADIERSLKMTPREFIATHRGAAAQEIAKLAEAAGHYPEIDERLAYLVKAPFAGDYFRYLLGFDEWMAHNFERIMGGDVYHWQRPVRRFMLEVFNKLRRLFDLYKVHAPDETFKKFLDYNIALTRQATLEALPKVSFTALERSAVIPEPASTPGPESTPEFISSISPKAAMAPIKAIFAHGPQGVSDAFSRELDNWGWWKRISFSILQAAKANPHIKELYDPTGVSDPVTGEVKYGYVDYKLQMHRLKMYWASRSDERLRQWRKLSSKENAALIELMYDQRAAGKYFDLADPQVLQKYNMTPRALELYQHIDADFKAFLNNLEEVRLAEARARLAKNLFVAAEIKEIQESFAAMRKVPYVPEMRFGRYVVRVVASAPLVVEGRSIAVGETIERQHTETERAQKALAAKLAREYPKHHIIKSVLPDGVESLVAMPKHILDALKLELKLSEEQTKALDEYIYRTAPAQAFVKRLIRRQGVRGFSFDLQRAYAQYFLYGSNHIARIKYGPLLRDAIARLRQTVQAIDPTVTGEQGIQDATKRSAIAAYLERDYDYTVSPTNDFAQIRGAIAILTLGMNIATAVVNLTQVAFTTYPELAKQYGDAKAVLEIARAYKSLFKIYYALRPMTSSEEAAVNKWVHGEKLTASEEAYVKKWSGLEAPLRDALLRAQRENLIDQSQAMELAAMAEGGVLNRFRATSELSYWVRTGAYTIMVPFELAEKINRRVTFTAAFRLAIEEGLDPELAYQKAADTVRLTQFEYSRSFRPELLRGAKGVFLMFMQFQLSSLYFATNGYSKNVMSWQWRWWALMLAAAGALGLPFAQDLVNLAEWALIKAFPNRKINVKYELKKILSEFAEALYVSPDLFMHGLSRYGFGIIPTADLSGSFSMGRLVPLTDIPAMIATGVDWNDAVARAVTDVGGATSTMVMRVLQGLASKDPDDWRRWEKAFPLTSGRHISAALRWYARGGEEDERGATIVRFDSNDAWHAAEMAGRALGFTPRRLAEVRSDLEIKRDFVQFYRLRRLMLLSAFDEARLHGDRDAEVQAIEAIRRYNSQVPSRALAITGEQLRASARTRDVARKRIEAGYGATWLEEVVHTGVEEKLF